MVTANSLDAVDLICWFPVHKKINIGMPAKLLGWFGGCVCGEGGGGGGGSGYLFFKY